METQKSTNWVFWTITKVGKREEVFIHLEGLLDFCSKGLGFYNYKDYSGAYNLVHLERCSIIKECRVEDLKQAIKHYLRHVAKQDLVWSAFLSRNFINEHFISLIELLPPVRFNTSTKDEAVFFYRNGIVTVSKNMPVSISSYENFKGYVWSQQINPRDFKTDAYNYQDAVFNKFLINVSGRSRERYFSLISIIGYLLHPYKDPSFTKAVILLDEKGEVADVANGGTGKSMIARALEKITPLVFKDAKQFNSKETFAYDDVKMYHRILYFDDARGDFSLEDFYSFITGDFTGKRKYKDSFRIPFELTPKLLVSSNYMIRGKDGDADKRRRVEFEISPHYSATYTPFDEFGHSFFSGWDEAEWLLFDTLMLHSVFYYMRKGLRIVPSSTLEENKLKMRTHPDFVDFVDSNIELAIPFDKTQMLDDFKRFSPINRITSGSRFKKWLDIWASSRGYQIHHFRSNGYAKAVVHIMGYSAGSQAS